MHVEIHLLVNQLSLRLMLKFVQIVIHFTLENKVELHVQGVLINSTRNMACNYKKEVKGWDFIISAFIFFCIFLIMIILAQKVMRSNPLVLWGKIF